MPIRHARAVQAFRAEEANEISLAVGDLVRVTNVADDGWWEGHVGQRSGLFPGNHVEWAPDLDLEEVARPPPAAMRFAYDDAAFHVVQVLDSY